MKRSEINILSSLLFCAFIAASQQQCELFRTACIPPVAGYFGYQWATCLTDNYIQVKSNFQHQCINRTASRCWYQCMVEDFGLNDGFVIGSCKCSALDYLLGRSQPSGHTPITIPDWCKSPSGTECNWYQDCLKKRVSCTTTLSRNAVRYAENMCHAYNNLSSRFQNSTSPVLTWLDGVRKCLLVSIVPQLRSYASPTCSNTDSLAFKSQTHCYSNPAIHDNVNKTHSLCQLSSDQFWQIFWTLHKNSTSPYHDKNLQQLYTEKVQCLKNQSQSGHSLNVDGVVKIKLVYSSYRYSTSKVTQYVMDKLDKVLSLGNYLAFANHTSNYRSISQNVMYIIFAKRSKFDLTTFHNSMMSAENGHLDGTTELAPATASPSDEQTPAQSPEEQTTMESADVIFSENEEIRDLVGMIANMVKSGSLALYDTTGSISIKQMFVCKDVVQCTETFAAVNAPPPTTTRPTTPVVRSGAVTARSTLALLAVSTFAYLTFFLIHK